MVVKTGIEVELAKEIIRLIKNQKFRAQASMQGDIVLVSSVKKRYFAGCYAAN